MLAVDTNRGPVAVDWCSDDALIEIHRSKISLHGAKAGYDYPTIRLPHTHSKLAGLRTRVYQTVYEGALAFLVVVGPQHKTPKISAKPLSLHGEGVCGPF